MKVIDTRYGTEGQLFWVLLLGPLIAGGLSLFFFWVVVTQDLSEAVPLFFLLLICGSFSVYLFVSAIQLLIEGRRVAQRIECRNSQIVVRLYSGRKLEFTKEEISAIARFHVNRWLTVKTLLDPKGDNYKLTLRDGDYFFVAGVLEGTGDFMKKLEY